MEDEEVFEAIADKAFDDDDDDDEKNPISVNSNSTTALINETMNAAKLADLKRKSDGPGVDDDDDDDDEDEGPRTIGDIAKKAAADFVKVFVDYGPAYTDEPETLEGSLIDECAELSPNLITIHGLLNDRADPNVTDPEDLHYTAMHWCGRNFHLVAAKMLRRAKADINRPNEFGITPFGLCAITVATDNFVKKKLKMIKWFIKQGGDVNHRDKGGFTPLDYAVKNGEMKIVKLMLEAGASTLRDNKILVAKREPILQQCEDPDVYKVIGDALEKHMEEKALKDMELEKAGVDRIELARSQKLLRDLAKMKEVRLTKKSNLMSQEEKARKALEHKKKLLDVLNYLRVSDDLKHGVGGWVRNDVGQWHWKEIVKKKKALENLYSNSVGLMNDLRKANKISKFNEKWSVITHGGTIEMKWDKDKPFRIEGEEYSDDEMDAIKDGNASEHSFRDENDAELDGEDLDDLLDIL